MRTEASPNTQTSATVVVTGMRFVQEQERPPPPLSYSISEWHELCVRTGAFPKTQASVTVVVSGMRFA